MSIINMYDRIDQIKNDQKRVIGVTTDVQETKNKITNLQTDHTKSTERITVLENKISNVVNSLQSKTDLESLAKIASDLESVKNDMVSKDMLKQNLDEISLCIQDFIVGSTPRAGAEDKLNDFENRIKSIEDELFNAKTVKQAQPIIRQALDTDATPNLVPSLSNSVLFKKPKKKSEQ